MKRTIVRGAIFTMLAFGIAGTAEAALTAYSSRPAFEAQGTIVYNYGFEDFTGSPFYFPGEPWTTNGVTYSTTRNLIAGPTSGYGNSSNVFLNDFWSPLPATINSPFGLFGLDLGVLGGNSLLDFSITTNMASYTYLGLIVPNVNTGMTFYGFQADPGEYFTGFYLTSQLGSGYAPAIDNVTLGNPGSVPTPEPSTLLLLGSGLAGLAYYRRKKKA